MLKDTMKKVKEMVVQKEEGNSKKKIENLLVFLVILVVTILAINWIWSGDKKKAKESKELNQVENGKQLAQLKQEEKETANQEVSISTELEQKLKNILSKIEGVGKVEIVVTYSETNEIIPMYNENTKESSTKEEDTSGGKRDVKQLDSAKEVIYQEVDGEKIPITQKIVLPKIEGAIITAEGARRFASKDPYYPSCRSSYRTCYS